MSTHQRSRCACWPEPPAPRPVSWRVSIRARDRLPPASCAISLAAVSPRAPGCSDPCPADKTSQPGSTCPSHRTPPQGWPTARGTRSQPRQETPRARSATSPAAQHARSDPTGGKPILPSLRADRPRDTGASGASPLRTAGPSSGRTPCPQTGCRSSSPGTAHISGPPPARPPIHQSSPANPPGPQGSTRPDRRSASPNSRAHRLSSSAAPASALPFHPARPAEHGSPHPGTPGIPSTTPRPATPPAATSPPGSAPPPNAQNPNTR